MKRVLRTLLTDWHAATPDARVAATITVTLALSAGICVLFQQLMTAESGRQLEGEGPSSENSARTAMGSATATDFATSQELIALQITTQPTLPTSEHIQVSSKLAGQILDAMTRRPLANVAVRLPEFSLETRTSSMGVYHFNVTVEPGTRVRVQASATGYRDLEEDPIAGAGGQDTWLMHQLD